jgi:hypothetical protein
MIPGASILGADYLAGFFLLSQAAGAAHARMIDFTKSLPKYFVKKGETARYFYDAVALDGVAVDLTGATVVLNLKPADGAVLSFTGEVVDALLGQIKYQPTGSDLGTVGIYDAEWRITLQDASLLIWPTDRTRVVHILEDLA